MSCPAGPLFTFGLPSPSHVSSTVISLFIALSMYLTLSWGAYLTFGDNVADDLLDMYPQTGYLLAAKIAISMLIISCYPLQVKFVRTPFDV